MLHDLLDRWLQQYRQPGNLTTAVAIEQLQAEIAAAAAITR